VAFLRKCVATSFHAETHFQQQQQQQQRQQQQQQQRQKQQDLQL